MKVYVYQWNGIVGDNECVPCTRVFATFEQAKKVYDESKAEDIKQAKENGWVVDDNDSCYECYEDGYYMGNHFAASIEEYEVETDQIGHP